MINPGVTYRHHHLQNLIRQMNKMISWQASSCWGLNCESMWSSRSQSPRYAPKDLALLPGSWAARGIRRLLQICNATVNLAGTNLYLWMFKNMEIYMHCLLLKQQQTKIKQTKFWRKSNGKLIQLTPMQLLLRSNACFGSTPSSWNQIPRFLKLSLIVSQQDARFLHNNMGVPSVLWSNQPSDVLHSAFIEQILQWRFTLLDACSLVSSGVIHKINQSYLWILILRRELVSETGRSSLHIWTEGRTCLRSAARVGAINACDLWCRSSGHTLQDWRRNDTATSSASDWKSAVWWRGSIFATWQCPPVWFIQ